MRSRYAQSVGWESAVSVWNLPRMLMELAVSGRPLLSQSSAPCCLTQNVYAPRSEDPSEELILQACDRDYRGIPLWAWLAQNMYLLCPV